MQNYNNSSKMGKELIFSFMKERMKEKNISQLKLAELIDLNESTLIRNFKGETEMLLITYLKICGALEINPYMIPKENDNSEFHRMFFN
ncbi:MAG: helix-turn-helix transcriptional regulator [Flavobacteriales bacterium]|nr:helix-turn-helix transcriptional regulator [Flavobacteriales bacterium]